MMRGGIPTDPETYKAMARKKSVHGSAQSDVTYGDASAGATLDSPRRVMHDADSSTLSAAQRRELGNLVVRLAQAADQLRRRPERAMDDASLAFAAKDLREVIAVQEPMAAAGHRCDKLGQYHDDLMLVGAEIRRREEEARGVDPLVRVLRKVTPGQARALLEAVAGWVENEQADADPAARPHPMLADAETILGEMNAARAGLAA